jgi:hypothetical protein
MGDRANIYLRDSDTSPGMFLYTHWAGYRWPAALQEALTFGKDRWGDETYLARIIASRVFRDQVDSDTGGGLSTFITDNEYPLLCVDLVRSQVGLCNAKLAPTDRKNWAHVMPFDAFVAIEEVNWDSFKLKSD